MSAVSVEPSAASSDHLPNIVPPLLNGPVVSSSDLDSSASVADTLDSSLSNKKEPETNGIPVYIKTLVDVGTIQVQVTPLDTVQDIKQFLLESADTCYYTSFDLFLEGAKLNDFTELSQVKGLKAGCTFEMREALYDDRTARVHVRRMREIMGMSFLEPSSSASVFSSYAFVEEVPLQDGATPSMDKKKKEKPKLTLLCDSEVVSNTAPLSEYFPPSPAQPTSCIQSITFSGWNPPPGNRRLVGDLFYLEVQTLEGTTVHLTAWDWGFFLNSSTHTMFNPAPSSKNVQAFTLVGVLNQLSASFRKNFKALLTTPVERHPLELMPVPFPVYPWIARSKNHPFDLNRAEDALVYNAENPDIRGPLRDWNEEFQTSKELPKKTPQERIQRDRVIARVNADFVDAASRGAVAVVNKTVPPINPNDEERSHMFIYNNIFLSYAIDGRDLYKDVGGDKIAHQVANNDLKGVRMYNLVDVEGLYTLETAVVDYRGHRVVTQSIIPGILTNEKVSQVVYGSMDNGKTLQWNHEFHKRLVQAGKLLHVGEHSILSDKGEKVTVCCSSDTKGIIGTDGRRYVLDLIRPTPRDPNFTKPEHIMCILRPELIAGYAEYQRLKEQEDRGIQKQVAPSAASPAEAIASDQLVESQDDPLAAFSLNLNVNVHCPGTKLGDAEETIKNDYKALSDIAAFLTEIVIPSLVADFKQQISMPVDGQTLTSVMHSRGINVRYLGQVATLTTTLPVIQDLCTNEMVTRAAKHIFNSILRCTENYHLAPAIAHFLNCFVGSSSNGGVESIPTPPSLRPPKPGTKKKGKKPPTEQAFALSRASLWEAIIASVKEKFNYELPKTFAIFANHYAYLRSVCLKVGITVASRDYDFSSQSPFTVDDVQDIFPIVKHINPKSVDAADLAEAGKAMLIRDQKDTALDLLNEALAVITQIHGPFHPDAASAESNLAMVLYSNGDIAQAILHQAKAVVINEKVLGLDHHDTAHAYGNLALFCYQAGRTRDALSYMGRALYLANLVCGPLHPDHGSTYTNVATMLQDLDKVELSIEYLKEALKSQEILLGKNHIQTAQTYHSIALAFNKLQKYKDAMLYQKKHYSILCDTVGESDVRTKESNLWLNQFTKNAVQKQIEVRKADISAQLLTPRIPSNAVRRPRRDELGATNTSTAQAAIGSLPLSEVLRYINTSSRGGKGKAISRIGSSASIIKLSGQPTSTGTGNNTVPELVELGTGPQQQQHSSPHESDQKDAHLQSAPTQQLENGSKKDKKKKSKK